MDTQTGSASRAARGLGIRRRLVPRRGLVRGLSVAAWRTVTGAGGPANR